MQDQIKSLASENKRLWKNYSTMEEKVKKLEEENEQLSSGKDYRTLASISIFQCEKNGNNTV